MKLTDTIYDFLEGQPETIVEDIESMVRTYVDKVRIATSLACKLYTNIQDHIKTFQYYYTLFVL